MSPDRVCPRPITCICLGILALAGVAHGQQSNLYTATLVSGPGSTAYGMNSYGVIVGSATYSGGAVHATQWDPAHMVDLGTLGGTNSAALYQNGDVVGWSETISGNRHAFVATSGVPGLSDLGTLGGTTSTATGFGGPTGQALMVGFSTTSSGATHAFTSDQVTMTDLGTLGGPTSAADAISQDGTIFGVSDIASCAAAPCTRHAVSWSKGVIADLGVLSASSATDSSEALGVVYTNGALAAGNFAFGYAQVQGVSHPVLWGYDGIAQATDVGALDAGGGVILGVQLNPAGIFGRSTKLDGTQHATLWTPNGPGAWTATDLNTLVATTSALRPALTSAYGENTEGWIMATSSDSVYALAPIVFNQSSLAFGTSLVGTLSGSQQIKITFTVASGTIIDFTVTTTGDFKFQTQCGSFVNTGDSCTGYVAMTPTQAGPRTGTLILTPQGPGDYPISIPLSGVGGISATLSAANAIATKGTPDVLTWSSVGATACTATGGGSGDGWSGALAPSGSMSVSESTAGTYTYNLTCTAADQTAMAQATVTVSDSSTSGGGSGGGGGGAITMGELALLLGCFGTGIARAWNEKRPV